MRRARNPSQSVAVCVPVRKIFEMWLACYTQEEIAAACDCDKAQVSRICCEMAELPECNKPAASHFVDFEVPLYNVWKQQERTPGSKHFGNSEVRWVDNLLYLYTHVRTCASARCGGLARCQQ